MVRERKRADGSKQMFQCNITRRGGFSTFYALIIYDLVWLVRGMKIILGAHPGPGRTVLIDRPPVILKNQVGMPLFMLLKLPEPTKIEPVKLPTCPLAAWVGIPSKKTRLQRGETPVEWNEMKWNEMTLFVAGTPMWLKSQDMGWRLQILLLAQLVRCIWIYLPRVWELEGKVTVGVDKGI